MSAIISSSAVSRARPAPSAAEERKIEGIYRAPSLHWVGDGFRVAGYFSAIPDAVRKLDPFLLLDYHPEHVYTPTTERRGVGVHPHRGFETVTFAFSGSVAHHDSSGGGGTIGPGDVQWMTAGAGILHKEYHEASYARRGGPFHMAQLWVNLPRSHKMTPPRYQALLSEQMGTVSLANGAGSVRIVAGEYLGVRGPAQTFTPINIYDAQLSPAAQWELSFPARQTAALLVMRGALTVNGAPAAAGDFVLFSNSGEHIALEATAETRLLVLNGEPIAEPIVQYGPFVMNSQREIQQAIQDYSSGKFGHLDD